MSTPIHVRYQEETEHDFMSGAQPVTRYQIYNECGIFMHVAECESEEVARRIVKLWNDNENGITRDLLSALEATEAAENHWANCEDCENSGAESPELGCAAAFKLADDARLMRRAAIEKVRQ